MANPRSICCAALTLITTVLVSCTAQEATPDVVADLVAQADSVDTQPRQSPHEANCSAICETHAQCGKSCDYNEEPECDEQVNYQTILAECTPACEGGEANEHHGCPAAAELYAQCQDGQGCNAYFEKVCTTESRRYYELCVTEPGRLVCFHFCSALEVGCLGYDRVGFRGKGCEDACKQASTDLSCLEAHYSLDSCMGTHGYACGLFPSQCEDELLALVETCEAWAPTQVVPEQLLACQTYASAQCRCGLFSGDHCEELATERCLFAFGRGEACVEATGAFHECMDPISECDRDTLRELCLPAWDAYYTECSI